MFILISEIEFVHQSKTVHDLGFRIIINDIAKSYKVTRTRTKNKKRTYVIKIL